MSDGYKLNSRQHVFLIIATYIPEVRSTVVVDFKDLDMIERVK